MVAVLPLKSLNAETSNNIIPTCTSTIDSIIPKFKTMRLPETYACYIEEKTDNFIDHYIQNVDDARNEINQNKKKLGYTKAVKQAINKDTPVGQHCVASQWNMINNTEKELGDTICLLEKYYGCSTIAYATKKKHPDCVFYGQIYKTKQQYDAAFANFVKNKNKQLDNLTYEEQQTLKAEFNKKARLLSDINPGSLLIIRNMGHMIMYCGIGHKGPDGRFVPDTAGTPIFAGFNKEQIGDFSYINTKCAFIIDLEKILQSEYAKELQTILSKDAENLARYIKANQPDLNINSNNMTIEELQNVATSIYFKIPKDLIENSLMQTTNICIVANTFNNSVPVDTQTLKGHQQNSNDINLATNSYTKGEQKNPIPTNSANLFPTIVAIMKRNSLKETLFKKQAELQN